MEIHPTTYDEPSRSRRGKVNIADLPSGTVLFRAIDLKPEHKGKDIFTDLLGRISGSSYCLSPTQSAYTFPFPYIGFGLYDWTSDMPSWKKYNAFIVYVLAESRPFINMINPSPDVRGTPKGNDATAEITRCDLLGTHCPGDSISYLKWDNCINRNYMHRRGVIGNISIAELDSIDIEKPAKVGKKGHGSLHPKESSLGKYLKTLSATQPESATTALTQFYTCSPTDHTGRRLRTHRGIPEITLYGNKLLDNRPISRPVRSIDDASYYYNQDMASNAYTILPVAVITANGIYDTINDSPFHSINVSSPSSNHRKSAIEEHLQHFMTVAQNSGIGSLGKMAYDRRTGFYVMENLVPNTPVEDWVTNAGEPVTYRDQLLDKLDTPSSKSDALLSAVSQKKPQPTGEFMFERPSSLRKLFTELEIRPTSISNTVITPELLFSFDIAEGGRRKSPLSRKTRKRGGRILVEVPVFTVQNNRKTTLKNTKNIMINSSPMPIILATPPSEMKPTHEEMIKKAVQSISKTTTLYIKKLITTNTANTDTTT